MTEAEILKGGALGRHADQCEARAQQYEAQLRELEEVAQNLIQEGHPPEVVGEAVKAMRQNAQAQAQAERHTAAQVRSLFPKKP